MNDGTERTVFPGMTERGITLRQWYAGMAMQAIVTAYGPPPSPSDETIAEWAFKMADAMLAAEDTDNG